MTDRSFGRSVPFPCASARTRRSRRCAFRAKRLLVNLDQVRARGLVALLAASTYPIQELQTFRYSIHPLDQPASACVPEGAGPQSQLDRLFLAISLDRWG